VIEFQGHVVPVIDMRRRFEVSESAITSQTRLVVFVSRGEFVAAIVDSVLDVRAAQEVAAAPSMFRGLSGELLHGLARRGAELVLVLNTERLLSAQERLALEPRLAPQASV
jgi:purine-binding chemotaxis protein CheW